MTDAEMLALQAQVQRIGRIVDGDTQSDYQGLRQRVLALEEANRKTQDLIRDVRTMVRTATVLVIVLGGGNLLATILQLAGVVLFK